MKQTPLYDALNEYIGKDWARFHMPGHKGAAIGPLAQVLPYDVTEVEGTDSLFEDDGPLAELEAQFTQLYGTKGTMLSAGGSTLCIQTMLKLVGHPGATIIAGRNIHTSAVNTMSLLDLHPVWLYPNRENERLIGRIEASQVEEALLQHPDACGVYITCPDYFGVCSDIGAISCVCKKYNVPLLVDNAHGAHLKFLSDDVTSQPLHPMDLGADLCCDSLHKTLPVCTGGALLHCNREEYAKRAKRDMTLFGSTSPNYLIMLSADYTCGWLQGEGPALLSQTARRCQELKNVAKECGFHVAEGLSDPMRITLVLTGTGYTKETFREELRRHGIMEEFLSENGCVFLCSPFNREEDYKRLECLFRDCKPQQQEYHPYPMLHPESVMSIRDAMFSQWETISVDDADGRIAAEVQSPCPPGIPLVMPGERICKKYIKILKGYGIFLIRVVQ